MLEDVEVTISLSCEDKGENIKTCENLIPTSHFLVKNFDDNTARNYKLFYNVGKECLENWTVQAQDNKLNFMFGNRSKEFKNSYQEFIEALKKEDKLSLSKMIIYPIKVNFLSGSSEYDEPAYISILYGPQDFINNYDEIFSLEVRNSIFATKYEYVFLGFTGINFYKYISASSDLQKIGYELDLFLRFKCLDDEDGDPVTCDNYQIGFDKINFLNITGFKECG